MASPGVWLAASYEFASTYSCRAPLSSKSNTQALPGPGPGTVRLALIRAGCEVFGRHVVQEQLFPLIRACPVRIRPPAHVAISKQLIKGFKARADQTGTTNALVESLFVREVAHAEGTLTIYVQVPAPSTADFRELFLAIGYWGQTDSLATCSAVTAEEPDPRLCVQPLGNLASSSKLGRYYMGVLTEFRSPNLSWEEVLPETGTDPWTKVIYAWPMLVVDQRAGNQVLLRHPFIGENRG